MQNRWDFTRTSGQIKGISDGSIEQFKGHILESLARENCQNSLDAHISDEPVKVIFDLKYIDSSQFPGYSDYLHMLELAKVYWSSNEKASYEIDKAIKTLKGKSIPVLVIKDFNTKGIEEPYSNNDFSPWKSITVLDGGSTKEGNTGGSYGIGKNAPYAASNLRSVFYRTFNINNEWAYQGISRFVSFKDDNNETTSGFGYYGNDNQKPINKIEELDGITKRNEYGSDIYIFGFCGDDKWKDEIVKSVLANFVISIYEEKLIVIVDEIEINSKNIGDLINEYLKSNKRELSNCYSSYQVLTNVNTETFEKEFHGLGTLELKVLIDPTLNLDKKSLRTRKTGMKLFNQGKISKSIPFASILRLKGDELGKYFLKLEPPTHDDWFIDKATNKEEAKQYIEEIQKWEKEMILKKGAKTSFGDISVEGLSQNLSIDGANPSSRKIDSLSNTIEDMFITQKKVSKINGQFVDASGGDSKKDKDEILKGKIDDVNGVPIGIRTLKGSRKRTKRESHKAILDENGKDFLKRDESNGKPQDLTSLRIIKCDTKKYNLTFTLNKNVVSGHINLFSIGENNRGKRINIDKATSISNISIQNVKNGEIYFNSIMANEKVKLTFELSNNSNFAMEVIIYEH